MNYVQPVLPGTLLLIAIAVLASKRWRRKACATILVAVAGLLLWSWPPTVRLMAKSVEMWYPERTLVEGDAEAIVVLAAAVRPPHESQPEALLDFHGMARTRYAAWLYHNWKEVPIIATGGSVSPDQRPAVVAEVMKKMIVSTGVPDEMVWTERHSYTTYQNAVRTARLLRERGIRRIVLVTEAYHMLRAERCFREQGLEVIPAPCNFLSTRLLRVPVDLFPAARAIDANEEILHEWVALAYYRLKGRI